jgi:hypothetical protein
VEISPLESEKGQKPPEKPYPLSEEVRYPGGTWQLQTVVQATIRHERGFL